MSDIEPSVDPQDCRNMTEVRAGVDAVDLALIKLLTRRFAYMAAAARIKTEREAVRDEARKAEVLQNVKSAAIRQGLPTETIGEIWDQLVEASIAYEYVHWDRQRGK